MESSTPPPITTPLIIKALCSLCAYQEEDKLRVLTPEEINTFHRLIQDEEGCSFCSSCLKLVIRMIKLSKKVESLQLKFSQSVTAVKDVLNLKRSSSQALHPCHDPNEESSSEEGNLPIEVEYIEIKTEMDKVDKKRMKMDLNSEPAEEAVANGPYKCPCGVSYLTGKGLLTHTKTTPCARCDLCEMNFKRGKQGDHQNSRQHLFNIRCPEEARRLGPYFLVRKREIDIFESHSDTAQSAFCLLHCATCDKKYPKKTFSSHLISAEHLQNMLKVQRVEINTETKILCDNCGKSFYTLEEETFSEKNCNKCKESFAESHKELKTDSYN